MALERIVLHISRVNANGGDFDESLIILSDVHLGNDINDLSPDGARRSALVDADLIQLLAHYRQAPCKGRRWHLIIAGDFIDFIGVAILPRGGDVASSATDEERQHGLGNTAEHARLKLRAIVTRHEAVFAALAAFVAAGHAVTIVHGNHDVELHWDAVKAELRALLASLAPQTGESGGPAAPNWDERVEFEPWFYYVGGVAYVEHGHQYDTLCSTAHVMVPLSPRDPRQIARSFADILLRWVVRPTGGMPEYGHERMGLFDYILFAARLGVAGLVRLGGRYFAAVIELFRARQASFSQAARALRAEHERRLLAFAEATRVGIDRLRALAALQVPPVTGSMPMLLAGVLLDCFAVATGALGVISLLVLFAGRHAWAWVAVGLVGVVWALLHRYLTQQRLLYFGEHLDNDATLVERAGRLVALFPAAFVVMGHTHQPAMVSVASGAATYVNVGSWHEAEREPGATEPGFRAARTHLVIRPDDGGPSAEFLAWGADGPERFRG